MEKCKHTFIESKGRKIPFSATDSSLDPPVEKSGDERNPLRSIDWSRNLWHCNHKFQSATLTQNEAVALCGCDPALHSRRLFQHLRQLTTQTLTHTQSVNINETLRARKRMRPTNSVLYIFESNTSRCLRGANNPQDKLQRGYESGPGTRCKLNTEWQIICPQIHRRCGERDTDEMTERCNPKCFYTRAAVCPAEESPLQRIDQQGNVVFML